MSFKEQHTVVLYSVLLLFSCLIPVQTLKVAIIGGGPSGLTSLKWCTEAGFKADLFEQTGNIGGVWNFSNYTTSIDENGLPVYSIMYNDLITNLPKDLMQFSDFPYPDVPPSFIPSERVLQYFRDYTNHFNLLPYIQFYKQVIKVEPLRDTEWTLTIRNAKTNLTEVREYNAVLICTSVYTKEVLPNIPGMESFKGRHIHSKQYRYAHEFKNQTVLLIGAGPSGVGIGDQLTAVAKKVILSYKPPLISRVPKDVTLKPVVKKICGKTVTFDDNSKVDVESIIYCTGYTYDFPFLTEACNVKEENRWIQFLYKHIINVKHQTMGFIGIPRQFTPMPINELQVKFFIAHLKKSCLLPSEKCMMDDVLNRLEYIRGKNWTERNFHVIFGDEESYGIDLANTANITPLSPVIQKMVYHLLSSKYGDNRDGYYRVIDNENFVIE